MTELDLRGGFDVETPEQVAFRQERAGLGARTLAALVDTALLAVLYFAAFLAFGAGVHLFGSESGETAVWIFAVIFLLVTFLMWGYYIGFEIAWNGQTPGKRLLGIRVVGDGGVPVSPWQVVIRNLLRIVDFQFAYTVGMIAIFASREEKRLGDHAAGTVVVSERRKEPLTGHPGAPTATARPLSPELLDLLRDYWARSPDLDDGTRRRIAGDLANRLAADLGRPPVPPNHVEEELWEMTEALLQDPDEANHEARPRGSASRYPRDATPGWGSAAEDR